MFAVIAKWIRLHVRAATSISAAVQLITFNIQMTTTTPTTTATLKAETTPTTETTIIAFTIWDTIHPP